jgi:hypothetical protein
MYWKQPLETPTQKQLRLEKNWLQAQLTNRQRTFRKTQIPIWTLQPMLKTWIFLETDSQLFNYELSIGIVILDQTLLTIIIVYEHCLKLKKKRGAELRSRWSEIGHLNRFKERKINGQKKEIYLIITKIVVLRNIIRWIQNTLLQQ